MVKFLQRSNFLKLAGLWLKISGFGCDTKPPVTLSSCYRKRISSSGYISNQRLKEVTKLAESTHVPLQIAKVICNCLI